MFTLAYTFLDQIKDTMEFQPVCSLNMPTNEIIPVTNFYNLLINTTLKMYTYEFGAYFENNCIYLWTMVRVLTAYLICFRSTCITMV